MAVARLPVRPERPDQADVRLLLSDSDRRPACATAALRQRRGPRRARALPLRRRELARMLADARSSGPLPDLLRGGSWLYHLAPYRTLFPPSFLASAVPAGSRNHLNSGALWGQFLPGDGGVFQPRGWGFVPGLERATPPGPLGG